MLFEHIYKPTGNQVLQGELAEHMLHVYFSKSEITKFSKVTEKQFFSLICFLVMWKLTPNWQLPSEGKTPSCQNSPCFISGQDLIEKKPKQTLHLLFFLFPFSYLLPLYYFICGHLVKGNLFPLAQNYLQLNLGCFAATFFALASLK